MYPWNVYKCTKWQVARRTTCALLRPVSNLSSPGWELIGKRCVKDLATIKLVTGEIFFQNSHPSWALLFMPLLALQRSLPVTTVCLPTHKTTWGTSLPTEIPSEASWQRLTSPGCSWLRLKLPGFPCRPIDAWIFCTQLLKRCCNLKQVRHFFILFRRGTTSNWGCDTCVVLGKWMWRVGGVDRTPEYRKISCITPEILDQFTISELGG